MWQILRALARGLFSRPCGCRACRARAADVLMMFDPEPLLDPADDRLEYDDD